MALQMAVRRRVACVAARAVECRLNAEFGLLAAEYRPVL